jgi:hypothetical protein
MRCPRKTDSASHEDASLAPSQNGVTGKAVSLVRVFPPNDIPVAVVDDRAVAVYPTGTEAEQCYTDCAHYTDDHKDHAHGVEIDTVLIWINGDGEVENCANGEEHEAND